MARRPIVTCSPVASSMSISRGAGWGTIWWARATSESVVLPMAETTITSWLLRALSTARRATFLILSASATDEPPYFCTISAMVEAAYPTGSTGRNRARHVVVRGTGRVPRETRTLVRSVSAARHPGRSAERDRLAAGGEAADDAERDERGDGGHQRE